MPKNRKAAPIGDPLDVFEVKLKLELDEIGKDVGRQFITFNKLLTESQNIIIAVARFLAIPPKTFAELIYDGEKNKAYESAVVEEYKKKPQ